MFLTKKNSMWRAKLLFELIYEIGGANFTMRKMRKKVEKVVCSDGGFIHCAWHTGM